MRHSSPGRAAKSRIAQGKHKTHLALFSLSVVLTFDVRWIYFFLAAARCISSESQWVLLMKKGRKATYLHIREPQETESGAEGPSGLPWRAQSLHDSRDGEGARGADAGQRAKARNFPKPTFLPLSKTTFTVCLFGNVKKCVLLQPMDNYLFLKEYLNLLYQNPFMSCGKYNSAALTILSYSPLWII